MSNHLACGIDFGTSNSTCGIFDNNFIELVNLENNKPILPTVIFFPENGKILFGKEAIEAYIYGENGRLIRGLKSILGTSLMKDSTAINGRSRSFEEILLLYIKNLKNHAEAAVGKEITNLIMGRPVHFHDNDAEADQESENILRQISQKAGFKNIHFQLEPIAAAYSHEKHLDKEKLAFVADLGGGTSDFTVIRLSPFHKTQDNREKDILSVDGIRVGGTNFDQNLSMKAFMPYLGLGSSYYSEFDKTKIMDMPSKIYRDLSQWPLIHQAQSDKAIRETKSLMRTALEPIKLGRLLSIQEDKLGHAFLQAVEQTKIGLTDKNSYELNMEYLDLDFSVEVDRKTFNNSAQDLLERIDKNIDDCIKEAGINNNDIDVLIMTGGTSEIPIINQLIKAKFPNAEISKDNKFGSVGLGLAHYASQVF